MTVQDDELSCAFEKNVSMNITTMYGKRVHNQGFSCKHKLLHVLVTLQRKITSIKRIYDNLRIKTAIKILSECVLSNSC